MWVWKWAQAAATLTLGTLGVASVAHADALADIKSRGTLVCGTQNASEPYAFPDAATRQIVGFDVDVCSALAKGLGVKLEHRALSTDARIPELKTHRVDVLAAAVAWMPARAAQVDFSNQYFVAPIRVLVRADSPIQTLDQLANKKIAASEGSSSAAVSVSPAGTGSAGEPTTGATRRVRATATKRAMTSHSCDRRRSTTATSRWFSRSG